MNPGTTSATPPKSDLVAVLLSIASIAVLLATSLASFRRGFADDLATDWLVNGPRVLFAAAVGAALANAISDALGVEVTRLPMKPDYVHELARRSRQWS